jgi:hypothetical protein
LAILLHCTSLSSSVPPSKSEFVAISTSTKQSSQLSLFIYITTVLFIAALKNISGFALLNVVFGIVIMFTQGAILPFPEFVDVFIENQVLTSFQYLFFKYIETVCVQYSSYFCIKQSCSVIGVLVPQVNSFEPIVDM